MITVNMVYPPFLGIKIAPFTDVKDACLRLLCGMVCVYDTITFFLVSLEVRLSEPQHLPFPGVSVHNQNPV